MTTATDFAKQLSRFLSEYLPHERNVSPNTLFAYRDAFVQYIDYMHTRQGVAVEKLCLKHLTRQSVLGYLNWILDERHCSPATRNYRLAAIHAFVLYLQYNVIALSEDWQKISSIKAMRTEKGYDFFFNSPMTQPGKEEGIWLCSPSCMTRERECRS